MFEISYSPSWFYGQDIAIDLASAAVLLLIAYFSFRYYRLYDEQRNYLKLAVAFLMLAVGFICKVVMHSIVASERLTPHIDGGVVSVTSAALVSSDALFLFSFFTYRFLLIYALYALYTIYEPQTKLNSWLALYLVFVSVYFSTDEYLVYHLTAFVLMLLTVFALVRKYRARHSSTFRLFITGFAILAVSRFLFMLVPVDGAFYVLAELVQLIGFSVLLWLFIKVLRNDRKAIPA